MKVEDVKVGRRHAGKVVSWKNLYSSSEKLG